MASPNTAPAHCVLVRVVGGYFDHYLHHSVSRDGLVPVDEFFLPEKLALVLVRFHTQRRNRQQLSLWPPPNSASAALSDAPGALVAPAAAPRSLCLLQRS